MRVNVMGVSKMIFRRWVKCAVVGIFFLLGESNGWAQYATIPLVAPTTAPPRGGAGPIALLLSSQPPGEAQPEKAVPSEEPSSGFLERSWSGPTEGSERQKTFWETVPPVTPYPRPGNFVIAPKGPGYYTVLDLLRGRELPDRPHDPYLQWGQNANPFFNADFRFLDNPANTETDILDPIKRIHLGDDFLLSTGGEIRDRYTNLQNANAFNKKPQAGTEDIYDLFRARVYGDVWFLDRFRIFGEFITANSGSSGRSVRFPNSLEG
jgi:hypothetical protein